MMTRDDWFALLKYCGCGQFDAARWSPFFEQHCQPEHFSLGLEEMDDFVGNILTESFWLHRLEENLNYSGARLLQVWPTRFPNIEATAPYVGNPQALANYIYGGRFGNTEPGDGFKYRGRGLIQVTFKDNYQLIDDALGTSYVQQPDLLTDPTHALPVAIAWWEKKVPDAAMADVRRVTKAVNGGQEGYDNRLSITTRARKYLHG